MEAAKRLLVGSVFGPSPHNKKWLMLQNEFLKKNTCLSYDYKVISNNVDEVIFERDKLLIKNDKNIGHPAALHQMIEYMRSVKDDYEYFLILDSDCFPVMYGWDVILSSQMKSFKKSVCAPIRYENLDQFPHPCAVYMSRNGLTDPRLNFSYEKINNLLSHEINEVGGAMNRMIKKVLPLLRTNVINLHPVAAGIYHHVFYHHGAGSRGFDFRVVKDYCYYTHWLGLESHKEFGDELLKLLFDDPNGFINKLMSGR